MWFEFMPGKHSRCDRQDLGSDGPATADIRGGITNDPNPIRQDKRVSLVHGPQCISGDIIPVQIFVTKSSKRKVMIQLIMG